MRHLSHAGKVPHTVILAQLLLALVVNGKPDSPGGQISHDYWPKTSVHAAQTLISPYDLRSAEQSIVHLGLAHMPPMAQVGHAALSLELCLNNIEGTGHYARGEASNCTS